MANKNTKRNRKLTGYGKKTGICVDSSTLRRLSGKKPAATPNR